MKDKPCAATRKLDELGRIVIPSAVRAQLGWEPQDGIQMTLETAGLLLTKAEPYTACSLCGSRDKSVLIPVTGERALCRSCINLIRELPED